MRYCWCPHHGQAGPSFSPRGCLTRLVTGSCQGSTLQYSNLKMRPRKFRALLFLEVLYRKILPGKFISWDSKRQQILGNTKKWPNSLAKVVTVGLWQCSLADLQTLATTSWVALLAHLLEPCTSHLPLPGCLPADSHPDICLGQVQGKKGKLYHLDLLKKSHGAECHQHTHSTVAKPQLPCEHSAGAVTERICGTHL